MYLISRLRVALNRIAARMLKFPTPFSLVGPDSSLALCRTIVRTGAQRVLFITDGLLFKLGILQRMIDALKAEGVEVDVFSEVAPDPGYELVLAGIERVKAFAPDAVIAVGGGSPIDCAKAILLSHANTCHPAKLTGLWLYAAPRKPTLPFYAVPTTAGTGSEVTIASIVSDTANKTKRAIIDPKTTPGMIALDPMLMTGLPPFITAPTGMDALTHCVEAYISTMGWKETDTLARTAAAMVMRNLPVCYADGQNLIAREDMLIASCMAGMAFTRAGVGYVHAFAHQIGGRYHVPHGLANAIIMPCVLDFVKPACADRLADLARVSGIGSDDMSDLQRAEAFIARIRQMAADMQIPATLKDLRREDFEGIIDFAFAEAHGTYGVPRYMSRSDARALLERLLVP